jgi:hypothetical protein
VATEWRHWEDADKSALDFMLAEGVVVSSLDELRRLLPAGMVADGDRQVRREAVKALEIHLQGDFGLVPINLYREDKVEDSYRDKTEVRFLGEALKVVRVGRQSGNWRTCSYLLSGDKPRPRLRTASINCDIHKTDEDVRAVLGALSGREVVRFQWDVEVAFKVPAAAMPQSEAKPNVPN